MLTAIGIPTFNRGNILLNTINEVLSHDIPVDEIIVVDQSDWYPEGVREQLDILSQQGAIVYLRQDTPNLPMARNRILVESTCDIVIFIDDDVSLSSGFVAAHKANYTDQDVWAVCGGLSEEELPIRPFRQRTWPKILDYKHFDLAWGTREEDFGNFKGCNHSVRRGIALELNGYDEAFQGVALREETDMAFRIMDADGRIVFDPEAHLHHLRAPAGGCRVNTWGDWSAGRASMRFALKNRKLLGRYVWPELWYAYRLGVLNRNNWKHPGRIAVRTGMFLSAMALGLIGCQIPKSWTGSL